MMIEIETEKESKHYKFVLEGYITLNQSKKRKIRSVNGRVQ